MSSTCLCNPLTPTDVLTTISVYANNTARTALIVHANPQDFSYSMVWVALFSCLEVWIGIIAACVPSVRVLLTSCRRDGSAAKSTKSRSRTSSPTEPVLAKPAYNYMPNGELSVGFSERRMPNRIGGWGPLVNDQERENAGRDGLGEGDENILLREGLPGIANGNRQYLTDRPLPLLPRDVSPITPPTPLRSPVHLVNDSREYGRVLSSTPRIRQEQAIFYLCGTRAGAFLILYWYYGSVVVGKVCEVAYRNGSNHG